jgi:hypothetical protein
MYILLYTAGSYFLPSLGQSVRHECINIQDLYPPKNQKFIFLSMQTIIYFLDAMRNLIIDGAAGGKTCKTKRRHDVTFPLLTLHRGKDRVVFLQDFSKKNTLSIPASCRFFVRKTDDILWTLLLMHDGVSFDKILPKQVGYFGTWNNWKQR